MHEPKATYGIIGHPLNHSLSPLMHNTAFKELEVDAVYKKFSLKEDELDEFFTKLRNKSSSIFGLNVTVPYKEKVIQYLDSLTPLAQRIMAVNTIVINQKRKLVGYNTDSPGFLAHLAELNFKTQDKRVAILGAGGSAKAIVATLCMIPERPESIKVYNRTFSRAQEMMADLSSRIDMSIVEIVDDVDALNIELSDLFINTTSVGLKATDPNLVEPDMLHADMFVYDLVYNPAETPLLKMAKAIGAKTSNGLGMLYYQGLLSFQHWANIQLPEIVKNKMRESLEEALGNE